MNYELHRNVKLPDSLDHDFSKSELLHDLDEVFNLLKLFGSDARFEIVVSVKKFEDSFSYTLEDFKNDWVESNDFASYDFFISLKSPFESDINIVFHHGVFNDFTMNKDVSAFARGKNHVGEVEKFINSVVGCKNFYTQAKEEPQQKPIVVSVTNSEDERKYIENREEKNSKDDKIHNWKIAVVGGICTILGALLAVIVQHFIH